MTPRRMLKTLGMLCVRPAGQVGWVRPKEGFGVIKPSLGADARDPGRVHWVGFASVRRPGWYYLFGVDPGAPSNDVASLSCIHVFQPRNGETAWLKTAHGVVGSWALSEVSAMPKGVWQGAKGAPRRFLAARKAQPQLTGSCTNPRGTAVSIRLNLGL